ncbi:MAG: penicillin-binding protein activator LpoB [Bdellovibrionota bacterium]
MRIREFSLWSIFLMIAMFFVACGPKAFTRGDYDDPSRVELLDDKFNESDMQQMSETVVKAIVACDYVTKSAKPPVVIVEKVQNRTEEHIDTVSMTDKIRTTLIKSGKVRFVNKEERGTLEDEYGHSASGTVEAATAKKRGKQIGADYILSGAIATNVQQVGNDKFVYYKLTINLTNVDTSTIDCTEEKEIRKKYRKHSVGL